MLYDDVTKSSHLSLPMVVDGDRAPLNQPISNAGKDEDSWKINL